MAKPIEWKDCFGRRIQVGDYVAYGSREGNSGKISAGKVLELVEKKDEYSDHVTPKVKLARFDQGWSERKFFKSTVEQLHQLIVITGDSLPEDIRQGLDCLKL